VDDVAEPAIVPPVATMTIRGLGLCAGGWACDGVADEASQSAAAATHRIDG
jgi:hypothetical protein